MLDSDAQAVAQAILKAIGPLPPLRRLRNPSPPPVRVLQCVLANSTFYDDSVATRFRAACPEVQTCRDLRGVLERPGGPRGFLLQVLDLRDARRAVVLPQVLDYFIEVQQRFAGQTESQRLRAWARWARPGDFYSIGIAGFGLVEFQHMRILFGANAAPAHAGAARQMRRLLRKPISPVHGLYLLERAAEIGDFDVTDIVAPLRDAGWTT